ncbi:MAG: hypothetical protein N2691_05760 [Patescibacteria group bacterium]|nr:hypothetical protein [Patescibacteria group bacterium]
MLFFHVFILLLIVRALDFGVSLVAPQFLPYLAFFPYHEMLPETELPRWLYSFANFDGLHYAIIADQGYLKYQQAYFPLFPLLIRFVAPLLGNNFILTGILLALLIGSVGILLFAGYARDLLGSADAARWSVVFLLVFPTSFFLGAAYTESLFLVCATGYLWGIHKRKYALAGLFGLAAGATRLIGSFLALSLLVVFLLEALAKLQKNPARSTPQSARVVFSTGISGAILAMRAIILEIYRQPVRLLALGGPLAGLGAYMTYLYLQTGDPLFFYNAQPAFGANRSTELVLLPQVAYRYIKIFFTAEPNYQYFVAVLEFGLFFAVLGILFFEVWKLRNNWAKRENAERIGVAVFGLASMMLPTITGTLSSTPRYALMALTTFFVLSTIKSLPLKIGLTIVLGVLHMVLLALFIQGYFVG